MRTTAIPMVMCSVLLGALLIGVANLGVDLLYTWLDPRVRLNECAKLLSHPTLVRIHL